MDPAGVEATKRALTNLKELALEGETQIEGAPMKLKVEDILRYVGLDDDIIWSQFPYARK